MKELYLTKEHGLDGNQDSPSIECLGLFGVAAAHVADACGWQRCSSPRGWDGITLRGSDGCAYARGCLCGQKQMAEIIKAIQTSAETIAHHAADVPYIAQRYKSRFPTGKTRATTPPAATTTETGDAEMSTGDNVTDEAKTTNKEAEKENTASPCPSLFFFSLSFALLWH